MKLGFNNGRTVKYMQEGGMAPAPEAAGAPAPEAGGAPAGPEAGGQEEIIAELQQMAQQIIQQLGPDAAAALAQMIMEMLQGGGAPEEGAPAEEGEPVYRNGGRLAYRRK